MSLYSGVTIETPVLNPSWLQLRQYDGKGSTKTIYLAGTGEITALRNALTREIRRRTRAGQ